VGGVHWVTTRSTPLAQNRAISLILQPPGFEEQTLQPKTWVPLRRAGAAPQANAARQATLRVTITPVTTPRAIWAKATRNYVRAFHAVPFWRYVGNSLLLVGLTTLGTLFSSTFVAYAFARLRWPGRSAAMLLLLSTMMLPAQVTMVPSFLIWRTLGWYNTLNPLWVPSFLGVAFFIFLMTQHMKTIPRELEESARVDGLNAVQTWYYIILPQVKPAAAAVAVMTFMWSWNEFLSPLIYLRDQTRFPLSLGLFTMRLENFGDWSLIMAGNVLMTLPVIVLFFLCQRYFIQGMTMSGMKG
jgi:ABC-type glycerol-3-phosphate transport system permease component